MIESITYYLVQLFSLKWIKICLSFVFLYITGAIGGIDRTVDALITLMAIDFAL